MLATLVGALAFQAPDSKLLALRGGASTDSLATVMSGLSIATGIFAFAAPKTNLAGYGMDESLFTKDVEAQMRLLAAGQIVNGATLIAAETDMEKAVNTALTGSAIMLLANIPGFQSMGAPTAPIAAWVVILTAVGKMAREGKISADTAAKFGAYFQILTSAQEILMPDLTWKAYKIPKPSKMGVTLFNGFVWNKLGNGLFLLLGKEKGKSIGLAASCATAAINCFKMLPSAEEAGFEKQGPLVWGLVQTAIAAMAFKNSM